MKFIDMHCDTLMHLAKNGKENLIKNSFCVDFERMQKGGCLAQFFAVFLPSEDMWKDIKSGTYSSDEKYIDEKLSIFTNDTKIYENINSAFSYIDFLNNQNEDKMSAFITLEDARALNNNLDNLKFYYEKGIRLITLTWNHENCIGYPNSKDKNIMQKGLKNFGKETVELMNQLGVIIDVSHLSDGGFWDVHNISKSPFTASHSNARELVAHSRNLTDDMIKAIANSGGIIGLNFAPHFLNFDKTDRKSRILAMLKHCKYIANIGGIDCLSLGSDLDGIAGELEIDSIDKIPLLFEALQSEFLTTDIEKIAYKNAQRLIKDIL